MEGVLENLFGKVRDFVVCIDIFERLFLTRNFRLQKHEGKNTEETNSYNCRGRMIFGNLHCGIVICQ